MMFGVRFSYSIIVMHMYEYCKGHVCTIGRMRLMDLRKEPGCGLSIGVNGLDYQKGRGCYLLQR